jgi:hypothetical protein
VRAGVALRAVLFQLAVRAGVALRAGVFPLAVRARVAHLAAVFQLAVGAGTVHRAVAFPLAVRAGVARRAGAFHLPVRARRALVTAVFHLPMRAGVALRALVFLLPVAAPVLIPSHHSLGRCACPRAYNCPRTPERRIVVLTTFREYRLGAFCCCFFATSKTRPSVTRPCAPLRDDERRGETFLAHRASAMAVFGGNDRGCAPWDGSSCIAGRVRKDRGIGGA